MRFQSKLICSSRFPSRRMMSGYVYKILWCRVSEFLKFGSAQNSRITEFCGPEKFFSKYNTIYGIERFVYCISSSTIWAAQKGWSVAVWFFFNSFSYDIFHAFLYLKSYTYVTWCLMIFSWIHSIDFFLFSSIRMIWLFLLSCSSAPFKFLMHIPCLKKVFAIMCTSFFHVLI